MLPFSAAVLLDMDAMLVFFNSGVCGTDAASLPYAEALPLFQGVALLFMKGAPLLSGERCDNTA
eukprot:1433365-Rhodomonas_salina.1